LGKSLPRVAYRLDLLIVIVVAFPLEMTRRPGLDSAVPSAHAPKPNVRGGRTMAIAAVSGEINYSVTSSTFEPNPGGGVRVVVNLEGRATGYGTVNGTLTLLSPAPAAVAGPVSWVGAAFLESGDVVGATANGFWRKVDGKQQWRIRGITQVSTGALVVTDAVLDLATRSYQGTLAEWT
jgi:hypothetical protein